MKRFPLSIKWNASASWKRSPTASICERREEPGRTGRHRARQRDRGGDLLVAAPVDYLGDRP
ncbi:MAG TPA: hypothetical protein DDZ90_08320, partial [Planctomycetaceae bacterium]|nr:hypothetical protein [Planctomycetaceae bacterium]